MCLYRAELFRKLAGIEAPILTFDPTGTYDEIRGKLKDTGRLHPTTPLLNLYEYYRAEDFGSLEPVDVPKEPKGVIPKDSITLTTNDSSGRPFRSSVSNLEGSLEYRRDYFRPDGSVFAIDDMPVDSSGMSSGRLISLLNTAGEIVKQYTSGPQWYRAWLDELVAGKPSAMIVDSAYSSGFMARYESPHVVKAAVYHSNHVGQAGDPFRGKLTRGRRHIAENPHVWDGIVFLTEQQKDDFESRFGETDNLFAVSNPRSRLDSSPEPEGRAKSRGVMLCRLEPVKNIEDAIKIIRVAKERVPDIRLDIYGDGAQRSELQKSIMRHSLEDNVKLRGFASTAADELKSSTFSLLTSRFEGQPLSVMESLGQGCPPISYDVRYGPGEMIENGRNGFLVEFGDVEHAAQRVVELCTNPDKCADMGEQAWESSARFDDSSVLEAWRGVIETMWHQRSQRTRLGEIQVSIDRLDICRDGNLRVKGSLTFSGPDATENAVGAVVTLQILPRVSGRPVFQTPDELTSRGTELDFRFDINLLDFDSIISEENQEIDFFIVVTRANARKVLRMPFGDRPQKFVPYPTENSNTSFKDFG